MYTKENRLLALFLLFALAVIWGSSFILMHEGLKVFKFTQLAAFRLSIAGLVFLPLGIINIRKIERQDIKWFALAGLLGNFIPAFFFPYAQTHLQSSVAGALNSLTPLFTLLSGILIFGKKFNKFKIIGILIGLIGAIILILTKPDGGKESHYEFGLIIILATLLYGINVNIIETKLSKYSPMYIASLPLSLIFVPSLISMIAFDFPFQEMLSIKYVHGTMFIGLLGLAGTGLGLVLFNKLIQITNGLFASTVTYLMPIVSTIWGVFNHESIGLIQLLCLGLILAGILIVRKFN
jgi:drug/metabolite transporter (DMT)-like permease